MAAQHTTKLDNDRSPWMTYDSIYLSYGRIDAFMINDRQFIIPQNRAINTYDLITNKWTQKIYDTFEGAYRYQYDKDTQCVYNYRSYSKYGIIKLNLKTGQIKKYRINIVPDLLPIKIGSDHHFIEGENYSKHSIWHENALVAKFIHNFNFGPVKHMRGIYIRSKREILIFGTINDDRYDCVWRYSFVKDEWKILECKIPKAIREFRSVVTSDERYVITFGGKKKNRLGCADDILVFDIELMEWSLCQLKCPKPGYYGAVVVPIKKEEDNYNVFVAFIRFMCKSVMVSNIPIDILKLINIMWDSDRVHLFLKGFRTYHYAINVSDILFNCL